MADTDTGEQLVGEPTDGVESGGGNPPPDLDDDLDLAGSTNVDPDPDADDDSQDDAGEQDPETFPREYVKKLRKESAGYRERAQQADTYAQRLHTALVAATGRLADRRHRRTHRTQTAFEVSPRRG